MHLAKLIAFFSSIFACSGILAASCWTRHVDLAFEDRLDETIDKAEFIFYGNVDTYVKNTIRKNGKRQYVTGQKVSFSGITNLKGQTQSSIAVIGDINTDFSCSCDFLSGEEYLIFANRINENLYLQACDLVSAAGSDKFNIAVKAIRTKSQPSLDISTR